MDGKIGITRVRDIVNTYTHAQTMEDLGQGMVSWEGKAWSSRDQPKEGRMDGWADKWTDGKTDEEAERTTQGRADGGKDGPTDRWTNESSDGPTDRWVHGWTDRRMGGLMDGQADGHSQGTENTTDGRSSPLIERLVDKRKVQHADGWAHGQTITSLFWWKFSYKILCVVVKLLSSTKQSLKSTKTRLACNDLVSIIVIPD